MVLTKFPMLIYHSYSSIVEMLIQSLFFFLVFLAVIKICLLCIYSKFSNLHVYFANIFFHLLTFLFIFEEQAFLILVKYHLLFFSSCPI